MGSGASTVSRLCFFFSNIVSSLHSTVNLMFITFSEDIIVQYKLEKIVSVQKFLLFPLNNL